MPSNKRLAYIAIVGVLVAAALVVQIRRGGNATPEPHAYDNILQTQTSDSWQARLWLSVISLPAVQDHLQLTSDQKARLQTLLQSLTTEVQELAQSVREKKPEVRAEMPIYDERIDRLRLRRQREIADDLSDSQRERLDQLVLQYQGYNALFLTSSIATLKLSNEQLQQLKDLAVEKTQINSQYVRSYAQGNEAEKAAARLTFEESIAVHRRKNEAVLTPQQRTLHKELLGEPFEFPK
ncbi:MAG TPA: hypothetical protein DDW52_28340 [Planctomycetaceae bacterium]|nr:hypothetical protein [Planctomycetaceae bacterium]